MIVTGKQLIVKLIVELLSPHLTVQLPINNFGRIVPPDLGSMIDTRTRRRRSFEEEKQQRDPQTPFLLSLLSKKGNSF